MTSKTEQTKAIITANPNATRQEVLHILTTKVGLTPGGASNYYQKWKNSAYDAAVLKVSDMSNKQLADTYNTYGGSVKKFRDHATGLKRLTALLASKGIKFA